MNSRRNFLKKSSLITLGAFNYNFAPIIKNINKKVKNHKVFWIIQVKPFKSVNILYKYIFNNRHIVICKRNQKK